MSLDAPAGECTYGSGNFARDTLPPGLSFCQIASVFAFPPGGRVSLEIAKILVMHP